MFRSNVKSFVYYEHHPNDYVMEHSHNCFECVFYMNGKGSLTVSNELYDYEGPTLTFVSPGCKHDETTKEFSPLYIVLFELDDNTLLKPFNILPLNDSIKEEFLDLFLKMSQEEKNRIPYYRQTMNSYFNLILCKYLRYTNLNYQDSFNKELVSRTKSYIKENYKQKIDFEVIANSFGYSYDRFRHIFKKETNVSLNQYLLNCRLYAAKQMLISTNMNVKEIALECGFNANIHFNDYFTKKIGISPIKFRTSSEKQIDVGVFKIKGRKNDMKKTVFIDTDLGGDCDDVGAIALANIIKNNGLIEIAGMTHTTSLPWGPSCIDAINIYYNNPQIPIGATSRKDYCVENTNKYAEKMANSLPNNITDRNKVKDAVSLTRKTLANSVDHSITFVCIGQLDNVSDLLDSMPDENSSLNGVDLVKQKVKEFVIMGGLFLEKDEKVEFCGNEYTREYNIWADIKSAQNFIKKVPVKVTFSDFKVGYQVHTGKTLLDKKDMKNPVTFAYTIFQNKPRESWDLLALCYAVFGENDFFTVSKPGTITIKDDAETIFDDTINSNHYYIRLNKPIDYIEKMIDNLLDGGNVYEKKVS